MNPGPLTTLALVSTPLPALQQDAPARDEPFAMVEDAAAKPAQKPVLYVRPNEDAIKQAIRDTLDEGRGQVLSGDATVLSGGAYREFARQVAQGKKAHCMGPEPLKHQPSSTVYKGWNIGVAGIFALPFWAAAIVRGKCNWTR